MSRLTSSLGGASKKAQVALTRSPALFAAAKRAAELVRYARRRPHEEDFAAFALFPDRMGLFLDVGANSGASALSFRLYNRTSPILSIEANPGHRRNLQQVKRLAKNFEYKLAAAGSTSGEITLWIPHFRGTPLTGEASVSPQEDDTGYWVETHADAGATAQDYENRPITVPMIRLDDLALNPDFVKIDVEGAELDVVKGLEETLARSRPILLLERGAGTEVIDHLATLGFSAYVYEAANNAFTRYDDRLTLNLWFFPDGMEIPGRRDAAGAAAS